VTTRGEIVEKRPPGDAERGEDELPPGGSSGEVVEPEPRREAEQDADEPE
jgi:hypothetical protein